MNPCGKIIHCKQRSNEWLEARCARVTASNVACVLAMYKRKEGETQVRKDYKARIVAEILTKRCQDTYVSDAMIWGSDNEPLARTAYEIQCDCEIEQVGFVVHPTILRAGCSPDGLKGKTGGVEFKCPNTTTHLDYILAERVPPEYEPQMMWCMACTGCDWWDFVSYDPRLPEHLQLFTRLLHRDDKRIAEMEFAVQQFLAEVDDILARLPRPDGTRPDLVQVLEDSLTITRQEAGL